MWVKEIAPNHTVSCLSYNPGGLFTKLRCYKMGKNKVWHLVSKRELQTYRLCRTNNYNNRMTITY